MAPETLTNLLHQFLHRAELTAIVVAILGLVLVPAILLSYETLKPRPSR